MKCEYCNSKIPKGADMHVLSEAYFKSYFCCDGCLQEYMRENYSWDEWEYIDTYIEENDPENFI